MCRLSVILLLVYSVQRCHAKPQLLHGRVADKLLERVFVDRVPQDGGLDGTTLGKAGKLSSLPQKTFSGSFASRAPHSRFPTMARPFPKAIVHMDDVAFPVSPDVATLSPDVATLSHGQSRAATMWRRQGVSEREHGAKQVWESPADEAIVHMDDVAFPLSPEVANMVAGAEAVDDVSTDSEVVNYKGYGLSDLGW
jgi:hypothetical protein